MRTSQNTGKKIKGQPTTQEFIQFYQEHHNSNQFR